MYSLNFEYPSFWMLQLWILNWNKCDDYEKEHLYAVLATSFSLSQTLPTKKCSEHNRITLTSTIANFFQRKKVKNNNCINSKWRLNIRTSVHVCHHVNICLYVWEKRFVQPKNIFKKYLLKANNNLFNLPYSFIWLHDVDKK